MKYLYPLLLGLSLACDRSPLPSVPPVLKQPAKPCVSGDLDRAFKRDTGPSVVDCGCVVEATGDRVRAAEAYACVTNAFSEHRLFRVVYFEQGGMDSTIVTAIAGTSAGQVVFYEYDGSFPAVVRSFRCSSPYLRPRPAARPLACRERIIFPPIGHVGEPAATGQ
jgi:hypothetical protein